MPCPILPPVMDADAILPSYGEHTVVPYTTTPSKPCPRMSIQPHQVICLECGKALQLLSHRHLALHGLTADAYKHKYGLPQGMILCASTLAERRRQLARKLCTTP
jgi:predicted transcriptional regulator